MRTGIGTTQTAPVVRPSWFGRQITVMLVTGKSVSGELTEVSEHYIVLTSDSGETQVMVHGIIAIRPSEESARQ